MRLAGVLAGVTLLAALAAGGRAPRSKQPRATRGFKNTEMMTARGFGKRVTFQPLGPPELQAALAWPAETRYGRELRGGPDGGFRVSEPSFARGYGKRSLDRPAADVSGPTADRFLEFPGSPQDNPLDREGKQPDSVPADWYAEVVQDTPGLARALVRKYMDTDQDGALSPEELARSLY